MEKTYLLLIAAFVSAACESPSASIPKSWQKAWNEIPADCRPVKIIHRIPADEAPYGGDYFSYLRDTCGSGGVVINYSGNDYLKDEQMWAIFVDEVRRAVDAGLRVWIYDEEGYPSPSAGGRVLEVDPSLEAQEMVWDATLPSGSQYYVRPSYEYTHACNNYAALRRYPDPGNVATTRVFTQVTHQAYKEHLGDELFSHIESFFTDEPSYMGVNLGPIPEIVRNRVRVQDEPDPSKKLLPMLAWTAGMDDEYKDRYGEDLQVESLFAGSEEADKVVRQRYWELMGEHFRGNFCDSLQAWCAAHGTLSSGHFLSEEQMIRHTPLYGNMLLVERGLDTPGLDMLDTCPQEWNMKDCWLVASLPESAAYLDGKRRIFAEISDHNQSVLGSGPATLAAMKGTAACHMTGGVTELNLYYPTSCGPDYPDRTEAGFKSYCEFAGRINAIVREAEPVKKVLLYYPAYDMQREFIPQTGPLMDEHDQSEIMKTVIGSAFSAGRSLAQAQIPFVWADYLALDNATEHNGKIVLGEHEFDALIIPAGVVLPDRIAALTVSMGSSGGKVVDAPLECTASQMILSLAPTECFSPANSQLVFGKFTRDGRTIYVVLNSSDSDYDGTLSVVQSGRWAVLDPDSGDMTAIRSTAGPGGNILSISLKSLQTLIYVSK